jgi:hypothetical protein
VSQGILTYLAIATVISISTASVASAAGVCPDWACGSNGTQVTGTVISAKAFAVAAVTLRSGEKVKVR